MAILFGVDKGIPAFKNWKNGRASLNNIRVDDIRDAEKKFISKDLCDERTKNFSETLDYVKEDVKDVKANVEQVKSNVQELLRRTQNP